MSRQAGVARTRSGLTPEELARNLGPSPQSLVTAQGVENLVSKRLGSS